MNLLSKFQLPSSSGLDVTNMFTKDELLSYLFNYKGVCRTASPTPGLLIYVLVVVVTTSYKNNQLGTLMGGWNLS